MPFEPARLSIPLHPGARSYFDRDEPTFLERYAEVMALGLSLLIAVISAGFAFARWTARRQKNRIDVYYRELLQIRKDYRAATRGPEEARSAVDALEEKAFDQLIDERLAADESFRIFETLVSETRLEISREM